MKKMYILIAITLFLFAGCGSTKHATSNDPRIPATFDYSPPSRQQVGSANLTIALVKAKYVSNNATYLVSPFKEMASSMGNDFEELLTAKGFTVRGPFGSRDEMVYNDKLNTDFAFDVDIDMDASQYNMHNKVYSGLTIYSPTFWRSPSGQITLNGSLVLTASSPQYGEKIWKKSIALNPSTFTYISSVKFDHEPSMSDLLNGDPQVYNSLTRELQNFYQQALNLAWQQIDVNEMKSVSEQAKKADKKGS